MKQYLTSFDIFHENSFLFVLQENFSYRAFEFDLNLLSFDIFFQRDFVFTYGLRILTVYDIDESKTMYIYENHLFNLNDSHLCIKMDIKKNP